jgi:flagellar protein FlaG
VATISATPDATFGSPARPTPADGSNSSKQPVDASQDEADLRLVIEEGGVAGSYVYKTVNRVTGEIVSQLPREEVLRMRDAAKYGSDRSSTRRPDAEKAQELRRFIRPGEAGGGARAWRVNYLDTMIP